MLQSHEVIFPRELHCEGCFNRSSYAASLIRFPVDLNQHDLNADRHSLFHSLESSL